jgi:hypothetical protein
MPENSEPKRISATDQLGIASIAAGPRRSSPGSSGTADTPTMRGPT